MIHPGRASADVFKYATKLYGDQTANGSEEEGDSDVGSDIEAEIKKELADIRKPAVKPLFTSVKLDTQCRKEYTRILHANY
jgi:tRNA acetyltransferase TAN1